MTIEMWIGFAIGAVLGFFIASVFAGTKFWELHQAKVEAEEELRILGITVTHLQQQVHPFKWDDDGPTGVRVREQLYETHPDLLRPGTETIRIEDQGDMPENWREAIGQGGETT